MIVYCGVHAGRILYKVSIDGHRFSGVNLNCENFLYTVMALLFTGLIFHEC